MDDGSVYNGIFDENNRVYIPSVSAKSCISVEIENPDGDKNFSESMTSQLLKNIMGWLMDYMIIKGLYEVGQEHELKSPVLDNATAALEGTAI